MLVIASSGDASAHSLGLSQSEFVVLPDGRVAAQITLSAREALATTTLDADHDGTVTAEELAARASDFRALVTERIEVDADGRSCPAHFDDALLQEGDGLVLTATYACPTFMRRLGVTLFFLSDLGPSHRHVARLTAGSATTQRALSGSDRFIALEIHPRAAPQEPARRKIAPWRRVSVVVLTAVFTAFMLCLFIWRFCAARKTRRS